ncbi:MAG: SRPBCC family protein [Paracoccaceae bacterium]
MKIENNNTVNASADRCWRVLVDEFADIHHWSAGVAKSYMRDPNGGLVGNRRTCEIPGFGTLYEDVTALDNAAHTMTYEISGMPSFVKAARNDWSVRSMGPNKSLVTSQFWIETKGVLGAMMTPMLKMQMGRGLGRILDEFQVYAETGDVHKRTLKARKKQAA